MLTMIRPTLVWIHRWVGLLMALFLLIEGLTGSILAFEAPIGRWLNPSLFMPASESDLPVMDLASLAVAAERIDPRLQVAYFSVGPDQAMMRVLPRIDSVTGRPYEIDVTHLVLDPHTGREIARLSPTYHGPDPCSGVVPFIKDLHYTLALGSIGAWIFFVVALAWTLDCLLSVLLTLPRKLASFWSRWAPSWRIKRGAGFYRLNFDLHRAGGLWLWVLLFVFAWSSVNLEDQIGAYDWVTSRLFDYVSADELISGLPQHADVPLKLDWFAAQRRGEELMQDQARRQGFHVLGPAGLVHFTGEGLYNYSAHTDQPFPQPREETVYFDGDTGGRFEMPGISDDRLGNQVTDLLRAMHMIVDPFDFAAYRWFICLFGLALAMLSVTGVIIWWRKHRARAVARNAPAAVGVVASTWAPGSRQSP